MSDIISWPICGRYAILAVSQRWSVAMLCVGCPASCPVASRNPRMVNMTSFGSVSGTGVATLCVGLSAACFVATYTNIRFLILCRCRSGSVMSCGFPWLVYIIYEPQFRCGSDGEDKKFPLCRKSNPALQPLTDCVPTAFSAHIKSFKLYQKEKQIC